MKRDKGEKIKGEEKGREERQRVGIILLVLCFRYYHMFNLQNGQQSRYKI